MAGAAVPLVLPVGRWVLWLCQWNLRTPFHGSVIRIHRGGAVALVTGHRFVQKGTPCQQWTDCIQRQRHAPGAPVPRVRAPGEAS